jgi:hypothetical protein
MGDASSKFAPDQVALESFGSSRIECVMAGTWSLRQEYGCSAKADIGRCDASESAPDQIVRESFDSFEIEAMTGVNRALGDVGSEET